MVPSMKFMFMRVQPSDWPPLITVVRKRVAAKPHRKTALQCTGASFRVAPTSCKRADAETRGHGDAGTRRRGDAETRRRGDAETRRRGGTETRGRFVAVSPCHRV